MVHGWNVLISELKPRNPKKYNNFGLRLEVRKLIRKREYIMLTVKKLQDAKKELLKRGGAIYVVYSAGKVEVWVNSGGYSAVSMGTHVIQILEKGNIDYDNVYYQSKNMEMKLQKFCDMVNEEYCKDEISIWQLNRIDDQGNIISGYQDISKNVTREQAITDYLYYLETSEGIENPKCECIEIDWE